MIDMISSCKKAKVPLLISGIPGIGKTAIVKDFYGAQCHVELLSTWADEDIGGIPYREGSEEFRTRPKFIRILSELSKNGDCCLFLDELDKARDQVARTCLTLIQNREVNGWKLPENCQIIAACNPPEVGGCDGISEPMLSRFIKFDFVPSVKKWSNWAIKKYPQQKDIIYAIDKGDVPFLDSLGEGVDLRQTCPRTLDNALALLSVGAGIESLNGLLTNRTVAAIERVINKNARDFDDFIRKNPYIERFKPIEV